MESSRDHFEQRLADDWSPAAWQDVTVLVAVSGGPDSVALLRAMHSCKSHPAGKLVVAHANHRLRGAESDADAAFVGSLCQKLGVPCEVGLVELDALDCDDGLEAAARAARYTFLEGCANRWGARYLVTAHTADDQAETILHRLLRGTGLTGLAGIPRVRQLTELTTLIRPLLKVRRQEVLAYLSRLSQDFREDASNAGRDFTRNRIRHDLLPLLAREYNPEVVSALLRLGSLSREAQSVLTSLSSRLLQDAVRPLPGGGWSVDAARLASQPRYLLREMLLHLWRANHWPLQAMGFAEWERLALLIVNATGRQCATKITLPGQIVAESDGTTVTLCLPAAV